MTTPAKTTLVPTLTGHPQLDTALGYIASKAGMFLAGVCITWMDAHGFDTKALADSGIDISTTISGAVFGIVMAAAAWAWGQYRTKWSQAAIVNNTVQAALTGQVPAAIAAKATSEQQQAIEASPTTFVVPIPPAPTTPVVTVPEPPTN